MPPLYFDMTVLEYLKFVADLKKIPKDKKSHYDRRNHGHGKDYRHEKSSDQEPFQRLQTEVGIAQAVLGYPEVIILDEPTVGLDPKQINEIRDLIKGWVRRNTPLSSAPIFLSEVSAVCDYVLIISHGKLVASDTPENLGKLAAGSNNLNLLVKGPERHYQSRSGGRRRG